MDELRGVVGELEQELARAGELRARLATDADGALLAEVERLNAEVRSLRMNAPKSGSRPPIAPAAAPAAERALTPTGARPTGAAPKAKPAAKPKAR